MSNVRLFPNNERTQRDDIVHEKEAKPIEIDCPPDVLSVVFLDGKHVVGGGYERRIRQWRVKDGGQVGQPMDVRDSTFNVAVSRDGKWIAGGTSTGWVFVWNSETHEKVVEFKGHPGDNVVVGAIDVSPDGTRIVTGSNDKTVYVWSLFTGERLLGPLAHDHWVVGTNFSPDGRFFATATWAHSIRIYDKQNGRILVDIPVMPNLTFNRCLSWTSDSKRIFALSIDGSIHCLDVTGGTSLSHWSVHSTLDVHSMAMAMNGAFIAASIGSSVSFWDTRTHEQIGPVIQHIADIESVAISSNYDLAIGGGKKIAIHSLCDVLSSSYFDDAPRKQEIQHNNVEKAGLEETHNSHHKILNGGPNELGLPRQLANSPPNGDQKRDNLVQSLRTLEESPSSKIACLEKSIEKLRDEQAEARRAANEKIDSLNDTIRSLRANLRVQEARSRVKTLSLDKVIDELRDQLATSQRTANQEKIGLDQVIDTLCADFRARDEGSGATTVTLIYAY
ncbi:WD40-repeat-containing domain protein [Boletus reticuloceps]|uniref:WD40-repeat-containing domain protein n=1 Tax=Boletus reticuloceps TaxID=495285 RepID=A0A8I2YPB8_9AGAM|nr:WD40-repeat-containing domain protein [Boletus reticuloceps]